jgi:phosphatidylserine/phosphatidylglycerophosphate/cardiolipin synthase-like enzyme
VRPALSAHATFGKPTDGNCIAITIDGKDTFEQMYDHMLQAERYIYIANYDLDPHLRFARSYPTTLRSAPVRSRCKGSLVTSIDPESRRYSLQDLLIEKAREGVEVKAIVWQPRIVLRLLPGADERGIDGRADEVETLNAISKSLGMVGRLEVKVDSTAPTLTSAHHEKIIVIDGKVGFCGGLDLSRGKWDLSTHDYESSLRDAGSEPWHDIHVIARGPVVADLERHFRQRWVYAQTKDARQARAVKMPPRNAPEGTVAATALRTWKEMDRNGGIRAWYAEMFRNATTGIYIENQFPFQSRALTNLLARRLKEAPDLRVIIVGPMEPNLPGFVGSMIAKMSVNDVNRNLARLRKISHGRVATFSLISQHKTMPNMRKQIYVHSKVMTVDDRWITVGSANLDKNGVSDSSEFNLGITSDELAAKTRIRLWHEHAGGKISRSRLLNFGEGFEALMALARANGARVSQGKPIVGSVYCYNFAEEGLPPPYSGAPDGNRFALL